MKNQTKAYLLAVIAVFFWSTVATAFKIALKELSVLQLLYIATYTTLFLSGIYILTTGKTKVIVSIKKKEILLFAVLGILNPIAYYLVLFKAYDLLPAQIAQPLNYTWPIVLVFLSAPLLKQSLRWNSFVALGISFAGVLLISYSGGRLSSGNIDITGVILAVGSSVIWALYWLLNARNKQDAVVKIFFNFMFGSIYITLLMLFFGGFDTLTFKGVLPAVYVGFFEMGLTFILWMSAMKLTERTDKISPLVYFSPFISLIFIHYILGEQIFATTFIGLVLIIVGVLLTYFPKIRQVNENLV